MNSAFEKIRQNIIGNEQLFNTCFGRKPMVYADYTASGRSLVQVENIINQLVLPSYANTHTETSYSGAQTSRFRLEAKNIIRKSINALEDDRVIFCGSGATSAINRLIDIMGLRIPSNLEDKFCLSNFISKDDRPVVFIGPYEHHSNELPWRESIAEVVNIPLKTNGQIDINALSDALHKYKERSLKIGSFSAVSNVTGVKTNVEDVTRVLKEYDALSFWDYAAGAPYLKIDVNGQYPIDAVFISPHKFIGGPGTPGILVAKESLFENRVPSVVGGGTVSYVTPVDHSFIEDSERREEGGTPAIVESIRAGLVFKVQSEIGVESIIRSEKQFTERALDYFDKIPQIEVLGPREADRVSIFSLRIKYKGKDLHYGFVTALLNDLFGIQARGGCSCAGPYGHALLGMDLDYSRLIEEEIKAGSMVLRPGWVRFNFNYFISEAEFMYLLDAIALIAKSGHKLLPYYKLDEKTANWHFQGDKQKPAISLEEIDVLLFNKAPNGSEPVDYELLLQTAKNIINKPENHWKVYPVVLCENAEKLRWFALPQECLASSNKNLLAS